ncbi:MAG: hypothetical protein DRR19_25215 [Candidatus Parabeggiatoa sp. nov. 1]|nr:MAG: hypothetical protein DRR19_25215 [Gammaproteobacteria bacterium]
MLTKTTTIEYFFYLGILTVSFDIFLVFNIGANFRISQILFLFAIIILSVHLLFKGKIIYPVGFSALLLWSVFILAFIPNTVFLSRSIQYGLWLLFNVVVIIAVVNYFNSEDKVQKLIKVYLYSFLFVALFGLLQFFLPLLNIQPPLVAQWWVPGSLARINGFSYEPSYYATYMIIGWVLSLHLLQSQSVFIPKNRLKTIFLIISVSLVLSSSRMGILVMMLMLGFYGILSFRKVLKGKLNKHSAKIFMISLVIVTAFLTLFILNYDSVSFLLSGTGVGETATYSKDSRLNTVHDVLQIFLNSPIIGCSLGGIAPAVGELRGISVTTWEIAKQNEGMMVFLEVLAASGIIGFIFFIRYIFVLFIKPIRLLKKLDIKKRQIMVALILSFLAEVIILQFNQTILRPYFWLHIAILSAYYNVAKRSH